MLAAWVERNWPLSGVVELAPLEGWSGASVLRLGTDRGDWVLKSTSLWQSEAEAEAHLGLLPYLAEQGFSQAPRLLPARDGKPLVADDEAFHYLMQFVPGRPFDRQPASYRRLGQVAARLHC